MFPMCNIQRVCVVSKEIHELHVVQFISHKAVPLGPRPFVSWQQDYSVKTTLTKDTVDVLKVTDYGKSLKPSVLYLMLI